MGGCRRVVLAGQAARAAARRNGRAAKRSRADAAPREVDGASCATGAAVCWPRVMRPRGLRLLGADTTSRRSDVGRGGTRRDLAGNTERATESVIKPC